MKFDRVLSGNVSIGIGLMLESLFKVKHRYDDKREIPNNVDITKYDYHFYNILTYIRNIVQSVQGEIEPKDIINILIDELNYIKANYYDDVSTELVLFIPDYKNFIKEFNKNKTYNLTKHDMELLDLMEFVNTIDSKMLKGLNVSVVRLNKVQKYSAKVLLTTSYLLDMQILGVCDLLESHTGTLKTKHKLNSKYATIGKRDLSHLPYNKLLHKVLGDKTLVKSVAIGTRTEIYKISIEKKWNIYTSEDKIKENIKHLIKEIL